MVPFRSRQPFGPRGRAWRTSAGGHDGLCALASSKFKVSNRFELFSHSEQNADSNWNLTEQGHDTANRKNANNEKRKVNRNAFNVQGYETVLDSRTAESLAPPSMASWMKMYECTRSRRNHISQSVCDDSLPNLLDKKLEVITAEGQAATSTFHWQM